MARSTATENLEALQRQVSLQRLAESKAVKLRPRGSMLTGTCPFHTGSRSKRRPVLTLDPKANTWACPSCRTKAGTVIDWVVKAEGISRRHAIELLRQDFGTTASGKKPTKAKRATDIKLEAFASTDEPDHAVMDRVLRYYTDTLTQSPDAMQYLRDRRLVHGELLDVFKLGFGNRTLGYRLPTKNRKQGFLLRSQLERLGIQRQSGHEHFNGAVVFPVLDELGQVQQVFGRKILGDTRLKKGTPLHLWLPGGPRGVFNLQAFRASTEIVLCKGIVDALTLWCHGIRNITATFQGFELHDDLRQALEVHGAKRLLIAFDRTKAGDAAADKLAAEFSSKGVEVFRVLWPAGTDCNDYARSVDNATDALQQAVRSAAWMAGKSKPTVPATTITETRGLEPAASTTALPAEPAPKVEQREDEIVLHMGDRRWRVRGLKRNTSYEALKVNVLVGRDNGHPLGHGFHVDTLEMYSARQRSAFIKQASDELGLDEQAIKHDLGRVLLELERLQDEHIKAELSPTKPVVEISEEDRAAASKLLRDPKLIAIILADFEKVGLMGEENNKLIAYLAVTSRKLEEPLAVIIQSSSASGKSSLLERVLDFVPEEERFRFSAMTGQSLYYLGETELAHKVLAVAEEAGAHRASYALKLLQSDGELRIASTGKDPGTGRLITQEYMVRGPVALMFTTTNINLDPELANRCVVLAVDEGREQTRRIHDQQRHRQTLEGVLARHDRELRLHVHRNAQRLLRPLTVVNPFVSELGFSDGQTRSRRDHAKYLTLIRTIALLFQHQRPVKVVEHAGHRFEYIEVERQDIELADRLAKEVLDRGDELPPQTRTLLTTIDAFTAKLADEQGLDLAAVRFTQRELRAHTGWGHTQTKVHLARLVELEHITVHNGGAGRKSRIYGYDAKWSGVTGLWSGGGRPLVGPPTRPFSPNDPADVGVAVGASPTARLGKRSKSASYSRVAGPSTSGK